jgi:transcriptional regulator with XRE-family HTH domain
MTAITTQSVNSSPDPDVARRRAAGARVRSIRRALGLRVEDLAARSGCGIGTVYRLERGEREPSRLVKRAISAALGVELEVLWPSDRIGTGRDLVDPAGRR